MGTGVIGGNSLLGAKELEIRELVEVGERLPAG